MQKCFVIANCDINSTGIFYVTSIKTLFLAIQHQIENTENNAIIVVLRQ